MKKETKNAIIVIAAILVYVATAALVSYLLGA
jgi:hypothetical protein